MAGRGISFRELLRAHRAAANLTQEALAARCGLSLHAVGMLEYTFLLRRKNRRRQHHSPSRTLGPARNLQAEFRHQRRF